MSPALAEACLGRREGDIPIGSVLCREGTLSWCGHNRRVQLGDLEGAALIQELIAPNPALWNEDTGR